jgi:hypothetical protein
MLNVEPFSGNVPSVFDDVGMMSVVDPQQITVVVPTGYVPSVIP